MILALGPKDLLWVRMLTCTLNKSCYCQDKLLSSHTDTTGLFKSAIIRTQAITTGALLIYLRLSALFVRSIMASLGRCSWHDLALKLSWIYEVTLQSLLKVFTSKCLYNSHLLQYSPSPRKTAHFSLAGMYKLTFIAWLIQYMSEAHEFKFFTERKYEPSQRRKKNNEQTVYTTTTTTTAHTRYHINYGLGLTPFLEG